MRHYLFPVFWGVVIFFLCTLGAKDLPNVGVWDWLGFDKFIHAGMFAVFVLSIVVCLRKQVRIDSLRKNSKRIALVIGIVYGALIEGLQYLLDTGRAAELEDIVANTVGCILGIYFFRLIYGKSLFATS